jgi:hypothetical protein
MSDLTKKNYHASAPLVLSGGLTSKAATKCYHAIIALAQFTGWQGSEGEGGRYEYRISLSDLHKLTHNTHKRWEEYIKTFEDIRDTIRLNWAHLAPRDANVKRFGTTPILSEAYVECRKGSPAVLVVVIPRPVLEDLIKPYRYGQIEASVLFKLRSNYAFNAYLNAGLVTIEKDQTKNVFYSPAYTIDEWRELLGVEKDVYPQPSKFKAFVFRRAEQAIKKETADSNRPMTIKFAETGKKSGKYQLVVKRIGKGTKEIPSAPKDLLIERNGESPDPILARIKAHDKAEEILAAIEYDPNEKNTSSGISFALMLAESQQKLPDGLTAESFLFSKKEKSAAPPERNMFFC